MSPERKVLDPLNPAYPIEMQKLLANLPEGHPSLPMQSVDPQEKDFILIPETLLINFYAAKETTSAVEAYEQYVRIPTNNTIEMHDRHHEDDPRNPKGAVYVMPAVPILIAVLAAEIEMGDKNPLELYELNKWRNNLESFRNNPLNQPRSKAPDDPKISDPGRGRKRQLHQITRGRRPAA